MVRAAFIACLERSFLICILAGGRVHNTQLKSRKLKAKMLLTCCHLLGRCCFAYSLETTCSFKDVSYFSYEIAQQLNTCPWRAPNNLFPQEATRPFTRTCTRPAAHKSCCRMACDCLSGGECPPRPNAPLPHDICEMIRFVTESQVFYIG